MQPFIVVGFLAGLASLIALIAWQGLDVLTGTLATAGWQVLWLPLAYLLPLGFAALSLRSLFARAPRLGTSAHVTWVGLAVNWLLPVAQIGGEVVRVRLLDRRGVDGAEATAAVVADKTLQVATQIVFTLAGLGCFLLTRFDGDLLVGALLSVGFLGLAAWAFVRAQRAGLFGFFTRILRKVLKGGALDEVEARAEAADAAVRRLYGRRAHLARAFLWRLAFRCVLVGETWLALRFLGHPVGLADALILESLGQAVRAAAFVVPGGIGAQEGGFAFLGAAIGLPPNVGVAVSLCKRVRELTLGVPGLLAWQVEEGTRWWTTR